MLGEKILPVARAAGNTNVFVRVPHSSGLLEGAYDTTTTFDKNDHRSFRVTNDEKRKAWLLDGLKKVEQLGFLTGKTGRTIGQAAIQFILTDTAIGSVLPNIYNERQLTEFAADTPPLTANELAGVARLHASNFGLPA